MDYEKKLKEALNSKETSFNVKCWINNYFPELVESEDERIRKELLEHIKHCSESIPERAAYIAWLEKQCEKKPIVPLDENGEPILTDFESALFTAISYFWQSYNLGEEVNIAEFVKEYAPELLEAANKQQKPEWSEEDEKMLNKLLAVVSLYYGYSGNVLDKQSCTSFLKSLKDRVQPQPKQEWKPSEEQMICLDCAIKEYQSQGYPAKTLESLYEQLKAI